MRPQLLKMWEPDGYRSQKFSLRASWGTGGGVQIDFSGSFSLSLKKNSCKKCLVKGRALAPLPLFPGHGTGADTQVHGPKTVRWSVRRKSFRRLFFFFWPEEHVHYNCFWVARKSPSIKVLLMGFFQKFII